MTDFELSNYDFDLPESLIAARPVNPRHSSKLMVYLEESGQIIHSTFAELSQFLPASSTLVFNRSKVFPCRLIGNKSSGGEAEVFILSLLHDNNLYPAMIRASGKRKVGDEFFFEGLKARLESITGQGTFQISFDLPHNKLMEKLAVIGQVPIPPYIRNGVSDERDKENYQTVYAEEEGSVAAPTAGLHFSQDLLDGLKKDGHQLATVTLHVGAGTFASVKTENILEHKMHEEFYSIDAQNLKLIHEASFRVAVGTTSLRTLESAWQNGNVQFNPQTGLKGTSIFLHPGKEVHSIGALITNFHLPKSTLLMLVSSLIGREKVLELYKVAIEKKYRFFSYGDGMLIIRKPKK